MSTTRRFRNSAVAATALVTFAGMIVGAQGSTAVPSAQRRALAAAPDASVCNGQSSFCGAVIRIESSTGVIGSVAAGAHYGPAWGIPPTPNDATGVGWCVDDTHTGFPAADIVELPTPTEWRIRDRRVAATIMSLYGGDRVVPYQPLPIDSSGELADADIPTASPTQLRHVAVWLALRSVLPDPAGTPRIDLASATAYADLSGTIRSPIGTAAIPIARRMVEVAETVTPIGGDPVVTVEAADGSAPTSPGAPEDLLVRVTDPSGRPLPHLPVWPDRRTNVFLTPRQTAEPAGVIAHHNAVLAGWPSFDTVATRQDVALTDSRGVARFTAEVDDADRWSASFTTESSRFRVRLFGDGVRAQNNVTRSDDRPTLSAGTIDGDARRAHVRVVKTSTDPTLGVAGALFVLLDHDDVEIARAETAADGVIDFVFDPSAHPPPYRIRELEAPLGLAPIGHDIEVTAEEGSISTNPDQPTEVAVENVPLLHDLTIVKRVVTTTPVTEDLTGFAFTVTSLTDDSIVATLVTDLTGRTPTVPLPAGEYAVHETDRPAWWPDDQPLPDPVHVSVPADTGEPLVVDFENHYPTPTTTTVPPTTAPPTTSPPTTTAPTTTTSPASTTTTTTVPPTSTTTTTTVPPTSTTNPPTTTASTTTVPVAAGPPPAEPQLPRTGDDSWRGWTRAGSLIALAGSVLYVASTFGLTAPSGQPSDRSRRARSRRAGSNATRGDDGGTI